MNSSKFVVSLRSAFFAAAALSACGDDVSSCPAGTVASGDGCVLLADAGRDASRDAAILDATREDANVADACTSVDAIDPDGTDSNCDGVDGVLGALVFVSNSGDDSNTGLVPTSPVASLARAFSVAASNGVGTVLVADGTYTEATPIDFADVQTLAGGYDASWRGFRARSDISCASAVRVRAGARRAIDRIGFNVGGSASSSYGVIVDANATLDLVDSDVLVDPGGPGAPGDAAAPTGGAASGVSGSTCFRVTSTSLCSAGSAPRVVGPASYCGAVAMGGVGGATYEPGGDGAGGRTAGGSAPAGMAGGAGEDGLDGAAGAPGASGAVLGTLSKDGEFTYFQTSGADGAPGQSGLGGGGGGGGASYVNEAGSCTGYTTVTFTPTGAGGGSGGLGGCPGVGGRGGRSGGASIAVVAGPASAVALTRTTLRTGRGGSGGAGRAGPAGGLGGAGGPGGQGACRVSGGRRDVGQSGGAGGRGGASGPGGPGGGGSGGPSVGVWLTRTATLTQEVSEIQPGSGGDPGPSDGFAGMSGMSVDVYEEP